MTDSNTRAAHPLLWAALAFSGGLWTGARAWRPPSWWAVAAIGFTLAAVWYVKRRAWFACVLSVATWFLLGCFYIQVWRHDSPGSDWTEFADGQEVTVTGHVIREGYSRSAGHQAVR